jgi:DNA modification methylase
MKAALKISDIQPIHPFPARMAPSIVWESLSHSESCLRVLDPMAGSGTTLVSTRAKGHQAIGCDTDPLALLIARAWCSDLDPTRFKCRAELVLERAREFSINLTPEKAYPSPHDIETRNFLDFWFDKINRIQLTALSKCISHMHNSVEKTLLWCAFSRLIITKKSGVSLAMDISHSRPHRKYQEAPTRPFNKFLQAVDYIIKKAPFRDNNSEVPAVILRQGDARALPFRRNSVDMVITSPPYLNAIDYLRGHKFSLVWMDYPISSLRSIRSDNIGTECSAYTDKSDQHWETLKRMGEIQRLDQRHFGMVIRYIADMNRVFSECRRVLKKTGKAVFVIGDSTVRGVFLRNSEALIHLAARNGFKLLSKDTRPLAENRRYLPPPNVEAAGNKMQSRMREEVILKFQ